MTDIRALGTHCYLGGFEIGVRKTRGIRSLGSMESWKPAITWAPKLGVRVREGWAVPRADYVFSNPPCSRFSHMSFSKFETEQREDLDTFEDMQQALEVAKHAGAELLHVESGPLMYSKGDKLVSQFNSILGWNKLYSLTLKISSTHVGLPQVRPRTHVFLAKRPFPELDLTPVPLPVNLKAFFKQWNSQYEYEPVPSSSTPSPLSYTEQEQYRAVFLSTRPKIVSELDRTAPSVVSSRHFAWVEEDRWWSVDEYAGLQGYDATGFDYAAPPVPLAMALISKSVSPSVAEYLSNRVVLPYFDSVPRQEHAPIKLNIT